MNYRRVPMWGPPYGISNAAALRWLRGAHASLEPEQKKTRQLPAGSESFGRGCLKGRFGMQCTRILCNCEMIESGCDYCNLLAKPMEEWHSSIVSLATRPVRSVGNCLHWHLARPDGASHNPIPAAFNVHIRPRCHLRSCGPPTVDTRHRTCHPNMVPVAPAVRRCGHRACRSRLLVRRRLPC